MSSEIIVTVRKDGKVVVEVEGVVGPGCTQLTESLENALGTVESRECKVEYSQEAVQLEASQG